MSTNAEALRAGGEAVVGPLHVCAFFNDAEEQYRALLPFASGCTCRGEHCLLFIDPEHEAERRARLAAAGVKVSSPGSPGFVELRTWNNAYLQGGRFQMESMLNLVTKALRDGRRFGRTGLWGDMEWVGKGLPGSEQLIEYESRINSVMNAHSDVIICAYQPHRYSASLIMDVLRTHPMILDRGEIKPNPMFVPTEQFLADWHQRRGPRPGLRSGPA